MDLPTIEIDHVCLSQTCKPKIVLKQKCETCCNMGDAAKLQLILSSVQQHFSEFG